MLRIVLLVLGYLVVSGIMSGIMATIEGDDLDLEYRIIGLLWPAILLLFTVMTIVTLIGCIVKAFGNGIKTLIKKITKQKEEK